MRLVIQGTKMHSGYHPKVEAKSLKRGAFGPKGRVAGAFEIPRIREIQRVLFRE